MKEIKVNKKDFNSVGIIRNSCGCWCNPDRGFPEASTYQKAFQNNISPTNTSNTNK